MTKKMLIKTLTDFLMMKAPELAEEFVTTYLDADGFDDLTYGAEPEELDFSDRLSLERGMHVMTPDEEELLDEMDLDTIYRM